MSCQLYSLFPTTNHTKGALRLPLFLPRCTARTAGRSHTHISLHLSGDLVLNNHSPWRRSGQEVVHIFCYNWPGLWDFSVMMYPRMVHDGKTLVIPLPAEPSGQDQVGLGLGKKGKKYWQISNHSRKWQTARAVLVPPGLGGNPLTSCSNSVLFRRDGREEGKSKLLNQSP